MPGVHPAQQRLDQPVHDLGPEPLRDQRRDRPVGAQVARRQRRLAAHPLQRVGVEQLRGGQVVEVERHPHQGAWEPVQAAAAPDPGRRGGRVDHVEPEPPRQVGPLGAPVEHRLGTDVDRDPGDGRGAELAADLGRPLQHHDLVVVGQQVGRRESGDATAHDDDPTTGAAHRDSVGNRRGGPGRPSPMNRTIGGTARDENTRPLRLLAPSLLLAAGLGLAGCGGAGSNDESAEPASSQVEEAPADRDAAEARRSSEAAGQAYDSASAARRAGTSTRSPAARPSPRSSRPAR